MWMGDGRWKELSNITGGVSMGWDAEGTSHALHKSSSSTSYVESFDKFYLLDRNTF